MRFIFIIVFGLFIFSIGMSTFDILLPDIVKLSSNIENSPSFSDIEGYILCVHKATIICSFLD